MPTLNRHITFFLCIEGTLLNAQFYMYLARANTGHETAPCRTQKYMFKSLSVSYHEIYLWDSRELLLIYWVLSTSADS